MANKSNRQQASGGSRGGKQCASKQNPGTTSKAKSSGESRRSGSGKKPPYHKYSGSKQDRRAEEAADDAAAMSRSNPYSFYSKYKQFAEDASRIAFSNPLGARIPITDGTNQFFYSAPGVMRIAFAPTVGVSSDFTSPMNRSSINYYARLRSTQKAFGDYDHQDLTMMELAIDSCVMYHALGRKIYGLLTDMTPVNKFYPRALISACNVQFPTLNKTIQDFRAWLNEFAIQVEQYCIPTGISLIERHQWMVEGIYTDSPATKAQTYLFVPTGFWKYNNTATTGSRLDWVPYLSTDINAPTWTVEQFISLGEELINAMSNDSDFATIAGDLYTYYGGDTFKLPYIEEKYAILPKYDETVLSQIENAMIAGYWAEDYTPVISQNPNVNQGAIIFQPRVNEHFRDTVSTVLMNMHVDRPSEEQVMEATRLMCVVTPTGETDGDRDVVVCGSELVQWCDIYRVNPATNGFQFRRIDRQTDYILIGGSTPQDASALLTDVLYLQSFDWAPKIHVVLQNGVNPPVYTYLGNTWDVDNMTPISENQLTTIHTAALYSLFDAATR